MKNEGRFNVNSLCCFLLNGNYTLNMKSLFRIQKLNSIHNQALNADIFLCYLQVFFSVLIGAFSLGHAAPSLQSLSTARGAAFAVYALIEQVCFMLQIKGNVTQILIMDEKY